MAKETYDRPSDVIASEGRVLVDGPGGISVAFTPKAAEVTGARLLDEAAKAEAQADSEGEPGEP